ncbi:LCP family protein [Williamsia sp. Leaf354]|uniref:LCP family protein n=1 Tax=Williamsia sp. Leaf354 TaxID=1736349 RepID=UPI000AF071FB|nr:LCP family protein [Williamsia sp. Leaf354]
MSDQEGPFIRRPRDPGGPRRGDGGGDRRPPRAWSEAPNQPPPPRSGAPRPGPARGVDGYAPPQKPEPFRDAPPRRGGPPPPPPRGRTPADAQGFRRDPRLERPGPPGPPRPPRPERPVGPPPRPPRRRRLRRPRIGRTLLALLLVIVVALVGLTFYYDSKLNRVDALSAYPDRVRDTPGTNWLLVGSDSRAGLTEQQKRNLTTGDVDGDLGRTDTMMLVHIPNSGKAIIVSIPRDLYVTIPGQGPHKINAAFTFGGPKLLVQTIETFTRVHIDHYAEIGFGGFDTLVDSVGGVNICLDQPLRDPKAGLNLRAGCQDLNGRQALGLVRTRAFPNADLERVVNQRKFLTALMSKAASFSTIANPFRLFPFVSGTVSTLTVDNGDHIWNLAMLGWALRGGPVTTTTPTGGSESTDDGDALAPDDDTSTFFDLIAKDSPIPQNLLSTNTGAIS